MNNINNENINPKSLGRIGYKTALKNNFEFKNNIFSKNHKNLPRTPLKSTLNIMNNSNSNLLDSKNNKSCLKYPLLKSISSTNINKNKYMNKIRNESENKIYEDNDTYNENALEDEPEDFMHIHEDEIYINNDNEDDNQSFSLKKLKMNVTIMEEYNPFRNYENNNYVLGAHFDEEGKKKYDDYFNSPDAEENELNEEN